MELIILISVYTLVSLAEIKKQHYRKDCCFINIMMYCAFLPRKEIPFSRPVLWRLKKRMPPALRTAQIAPTRIGDCPGAVHMPPRNGRRLQEPRLT